MTVYERNDRVGGLLRYGIPTMKLGKDVSHIRKQWRPPCVIYAPTRKQWRPRVSYMLPLVNSGALVCHTSSCSCVTFRDPSCPICCHFSFSVYFCERMGNVCVNLLSQGSGRRVTHLWTLHRLMANCALQKIIITPK